MPVLGSVGPFDGSDQFESYLERVELYFVANSIGECPADAANGVVEAAAKKNMDVKLAIFLTVIGKDAYRVAQTLCSPKSPSDYTYTELVGILKKHYTPVNLQIAESFKFRRCAQNDNESISEFVSRLRKCASTCNYETFLERALKEQFTVGLRNKETQLKLLSKEHSAIADEAAFRESAIIVPSSGGTNVNHVKQFPPKKTQVTTNQHSKNFRSKAKSAAKPVSASSNTATGASTYKCYSCGQSDHKRSACRFREVVCNKCSQKGHIAKVCISAKAVPSLEEVNEEVYHITSDATEGLFVNMDIEGRNVKFQIDTGCGVSIVPMSVYKQFSDRVTLKDCNMRLNTYTGEVIKPFGKCDVHVTYQGHHHKLSLIVVDTTQNIPLLGRNWLNIIQLDWASLRHNSYEIM